MIKRLLERVLEKQIKEVIGVGDEYKIMFFSSARGAIYSYFKSMGDGTDSVKTLVPDYVCNIMTKAIKSARRGTLQTYELNENLAPNGSDLHAKSNLFKPDVVVFAPIFGAYGDEYNHLIETTLHSDNRPVVFLDAAQMIDLVPAGLDGIALSFNQKIINGFYGGALVFNKESMSELRFSFKPLTISKEIEFLTKYVEKRLRLRPQRFVKASEMTDKGYQYSACSQFPFKPTVDEISMVSLIVAILEMLRIGNYRRNRRSNHQLLRKRLSSVPGLKIVDTEHIELSHFVPILVKDPEALKKAATILDKMGLRLKRPYALDDDPLSSVRRYLYAVENPFFRLK